MDLSRRMFQKPGECNRVYWQMPDNQLVLVSNPSSKTIGGRHRVTVDQVCILFMLIDILSEDAEPEAGLSPGSLQKCQLSALPCSDQ